MTTSGTPKSHMITPGSISISFLLFPFVLN